MNEIILLRIISVLLILLGVFILFRSQLVVEKIKLFYGNYPIIHSAGIKQLTSRVVYVKAVGITIIIVGIMSIYSI